MPTAIVTGGSRGIGRAIAADLSRTHRVIATYKGNREAAESLQKETGCEIFQCDNASPVDRANLIRHARELFGTLDVLVNNAGIALYDDLTDRSVLERHFGVNLFGPYEVIQAFLPQLTRSEGAIVNNLSVNAVAPLPVIPAYSVSKAAALSLTQALRALLAGRGVRVHAVLTGPTDTDINRGFDIPKASPQSVARAIFDGVESGEEDIFPDPMSQSIAESWRGGVAKTLERQFAAVAETATVPGA